MVSLVQSRLLSSYLEAVVPGLRRVVGSGQHFSRREVLIPSLYL